MIRFPVSVIARRVPTLPSAVLAFRMFPSPFARLFGIKSASFRNEQYRNQGNKAIRKPDCYQKVIICPSEPRRLIFVYCGAIFALPESLFIDYSGAKYTRFPPKIAAAQKALFRVVENGKHLNRLRNGYLEKPVATGIFRVQRSPKTAKTPAKVHLRLRFQNLGKPRTAGLCGRAAGACDCGPLSCTFIERPSPLRKPPCKVRFFANRYSRKYRQKVTVTTLFQTASHPDFQLLAQTAHACFCGRKWVHTRLSEKNRTQGHTRRNGWCFGWGVVSLPSERSARSPTSPGRVSERQVLPLLGLGRGAPKERRKPSEQRCAYARRCSEASRPRWAA